MRAVNAGLEALAAAVPAFAITLYALPAIVLTILEAREPGRLASVIALPIWPHLLVAGVVGSGVLSWRLRRSG